MKRCLACLLLLAIAVAGADRIAAGAAPEAAPASELRNRIRGAMAATDSIRRTGDHDGALAHLDHLFEEARAADDSVATLDVMRLQSFWWRKLRDTRLAVARGYEALEWATALRDTSRMCSELYKLGLAVTELGEVARADSMYAAVLDLARRSHDRAYQARALSARGYRAVYAGELEQARVYLEEAVATLHELGLVQDQLLALNLLGISWSSAGDFQRARSCFERCLALAEQVDYPFGKLQALSNLAFLEHHLGDPGKAAEGYLEVYETATKLGNRGNALNAGSNYCSTLLELGRADEAIARLEELLVLARESEFAEEQTNVLVHLGAALLDVDRGRESLVRLDEAIGLARSFDYVDGEFRALRKKAEVLERDGEVDAAIALLEGRGRELSDRVNLGQSLPMQQTLAELHLGRGDTSAGLALLRDVDARAARSGQRPVRLEALASLGGVYRSLERPDSTIAVLTRAAAVWEEERSLPQDPEWREQRGALGRRVYTDLAEAMLRDPRGGEVEERVRLAFDTLQRYKARTLRERMMGPAAELADTDFTPPDLARVQRELLQPGEVILDAYLGDDTSLLFVVTREDCRVRTLEAGPVLDERVALFARMLGDPRVSGRTLELARGAVREALLGDLESELERAERVLFLPDGALNRLPLVSLWPDRFDLEIARVPSMAVLEGLRGDGANPGLGGAIVAVAGRSNDEGSRLRGAQAEVEDLRRHYRDVRPYLGGLPASEELGRARVVHFAAHTRVDDTRPWRSGLLLASNDASYAETITGENVLRGLESDVPPGTTFVDASQISRLRLSADLAVLSGCESAGGRVLSGEGVQGLASAFLSARVRTVVATLWPVDDGSTQRFMAAFYRGLAAGGTVASALQSARMDLRQDPATAHPFHWAGFVALGDGATRVPLSEREPLPSARTALGVMALAGLCLVLGWRRSGAS